MISKLHLSFDNSDPKIIGIRDNSIYNPDVTICDPYLVVVAPGFQTAYAVDVTPNNYHPVNSNSLGLTTASNYSDMINLPDGVYYVKYSIQPHDKMYREYWFYRTSALRCDFNQALLSLHLDTCTTSRTLIDERTDELMLADFHLRAAEANINDTEANEDLANKHYQKAKEIISRVIKGC